MKNTRHTGSRYEALAADFLEERGLRLLYTNYLCRYGEIDLILRDQRTLVFTEVRYREADAFGSPLATVTLAKQKKICRTAKLFLVEKGLYDKVDCRFDVIGILMANDRPRVHWVKNAFSSPDAFN